MKIKLDITPKENLARLLVERGILSQEKDDYTVKNIEVIDDGESNTRALVEYGSNQSVMIKYHRVDLELGEIEIPRDHLGQITEEAIDSALLSKGIISREFDYELYRDNSKIILKSKPTSLLYHWDTELKIIDPSMPPLEEEENEVIHLEHYLTALTGNYLSVE